MDSHKGVYAFSISVDKRYPVIPIAMEVKKSGSVIMELDEGFVECGWGVLYDHFEDNGTVDVFPDSVYLVYIGIMEKESYMIDIKLDGAQEYWERYRDDDGTGLFSRIFIGIAPYGSAACWLWGNKKSVIFSWIKSKEPIKIPVKLCEEYLKQDYSVKENLIRNGYPPKDLYENYMKQYCYRYSVMFEVCDDVGGVPGPDGVSHHWKRYTEEDETEGALPLFDYLDEALSDGTHDKLHDGGLMKYHDAGRPDKLAVRWHITKSEYDAYFWFDSGKMLAIFDRFYGSHRDVQSDFIIRIDAINKRYELSMFRYGLIRPVLIPEDAYQVLVFKNGFENYRSANYSQKVCAWRW